MKNLHILSTEKVTYSERVKSNVKFDQRLKRSVLEISIEKTDSESTLEVDNNDVSRICQTLGMDITSQVEGFNIRYYSNKAILCG